MTKVLIVDDRPLNREYLTTLLAFGGYALLEAGDGRQGLELARTRKPDLIITDILMPGMDGADFVRELRTSPELGSTPIVFYTACYLEKEARALAAAWGVRHILIKPCEPQTVLDVVSRSLNTQSVSPPAELAQRLEQQYSHILSDQLGVRLRQTDSVHLQLAEMLDLASRLAAEQEPERLLWSFCHSARYVLGSKWAVVRLNGPKEATRVVSGVEATLEPSSPAESGPLLETLLTRNEPVRLGQSPVRLAALGLPEADATVRSFLGVRVAWAQEVLGVLYFVDKLGDAEFTSADEALASNLATQLAVTYQNARLHAEAREAREALEHLNRTLDRQVTERTALAEHRAEELRCSNEELQHFAYFVAHDLQEPLRGISGCVNVLKGVYGERLPAEVAEMVGFIQDAAVRMATLIHDLHQYARGAAVEPSFGTVDCAGVVAAALADLQAAVRDSGAEVSVGPMPTVTGDRSLLAQLFQNLLGNALKFRSQAPPRIRVSARGDGREWTFSIEDNGIGIEPQHAERIFQVFERLHSRAEVAGTGLGLAICRKSVQRHGGRIWVESEPGRGSTFHFTLPVRAATQQSRPGPQARSE